MGNTVFGEDLFCRFEFDLDAEEWVRMRPPNMMGGETERNEKKRFSGLAYR